MTAHASMRVPGNTRPQSRPALSTDVTVAPARGSRLDASGTAWRLRSLIAMGHDSSRIARALRVSPDVVQRIVRGQSRIVTLAFHAIACQLWDAWWDKTPPRRTPAERRAAARALRQAKASNWPAAAGLDEEELDEPGYRPYCRYRPALGTGIAPDFTPTLAGTQDPSGSRDHGGRPASERQTNSPAAGRNTSVGLALATQRARLAGRQAVAEA